MGISGGGSRALLIRRHTEWVNLVNANFDSSNPRSKRDLLQDLKTWDRYQGAQKLSNSGVVTNNGAVMRKDFDGAAWAAAHNDDFQTLIGKARQKIMAIEIKSPPNDHQKDVILDKAVDDQQINAEKLDEGDEASYTSPNALLESVHSEETRDRQSPLLNDEINQSCQLTPATVDLSADS